MSIEGVNADLETAKGHLQVAQGAVTASEEIAHTIRETVGDLVLESRHLAFLGSSSLFVGISGAQREVWPQDITAMADFAATGYNEARTELTGAMEGSNDDHLNGAAAHLNNAIELLREGTMDATTRAKMVEANFKQLREGALKVFRLLFEMSDVALSLDRSTSSHALCSQNSIQSIQDYQDRLA